MAVTQLMTEEAELMRESSVVSDGIGGYKTILTKVTDITCKIDARTERDLFEDDVLKKEVTNKIYTTTAVYEKDIVKQNSDSYIVLQVIFYKDVLEQGNDHYKCLCKKVVD